MELALSGIGAYRCDICVLFSVYLRGKVICEDECRLLIATGMTGVDSCIF